jgi:quercetin dioxygenase-like cupin family protein
MNITRDLHLVRENPAILTVLREEHTKAFVVGLSKDQVLTKHKTAIPALLIVLEGRITFKMKSQVMLLNKHDVFSIPVEVEHEVIGIEDKNIFMILKYSQ